MDDKELLKQADEFLDMAFLGDGKEQSLMYKMKVRLEELLADMEPEPVHVTRCPKFLEEYHYIDSLHVLTDIWTDSATDHVRLINGNVFCTWDEANAVRVQNATV